ncbi:unnamed protein product [Pleuronectes platessa]|uniref:RRM domain-containing protein n=1 Tax=Pleuronectes platessa TaxID=8262 RepID=A0A9N7UE30_PLEPL|nr:unnamed protein product [Pleuronectes platessa]
MSPPQRSVAPSPLTQQNYKPTWPAQPFTLAASLCVILPGISGTGAEEYTGKMAARWGAGEETLTACNVEFFSMDILDETAGLCSEETMEALQSCLDPSILSIFEDTPTTETKGLDEESEATLLTALTEILDNVDDENLSPFDTLPDSDLLSGQKGREHSPLRRLLCMSRSPPEKDAFCSVRPISTGKSLPRMLAESLQRSDGEEEDDGSLSLSPMGHASSPDNDLLAWGDASLPLPVMFEQDGEDGVSVSLADLVRHMHPYCMSICVEDDDGEQMLPEGGILFEVVDQGENGEPILAIPDMELPISLPLIEQFSENEWKLADEAEEVDSDSSEHIVVDDDDEDIIVSEAPLKVAAAATPGLCADVKDETIVERQKEEALLKDGPSCLPTAVSSKQPDGPPEQPAPAQEKLEVSSAVPSAVPVSLSSESTAAAPSPTTPEMIGPVCEALPLVAPAVPEPKPKSLSLAEYRRLREQKKPAPVEKRDDNSTKWPSLPELPTELPLIPCLPDPNPQDSRRPNPQAGKNEVEEVKPAWQPRGPAAPPTPEALLVPPAYMTASSSRVPTATPVPKPKPSLPEQPPVPSVKDLPTHQSTVAQPAAPQSSGSPASLNQANGLMSSADAKCSSALSLRNSEVDEKTQTRKSVELTKTTTEPIKPTTAPSIPQKTTVVFQKLLDVTNAATFNSPITADIKSSRPTDCGPPLCSSPAAHPSDSRSLKANPVLLKTKEKPNTAVKPQKAKNPTQELIESFTSEIGIEAADLTSLLEQFEETQAKEEQCVPEVSGRAAAVGNSSFELAPKTKVVERVRANDLLSTAALTPPATPPHLMWKPLAPVALLGKCKATEACKSSPSKIIQIEARPLPSFKSRSKPTPAAATVDPELACLDHDYCLPNKGTSAGEPGRRWNVKPQSFITIKPIMQPTTVIAQTTPAVLAHAVPSTTNPNPTFSPKERSGGRSRKRRSHRSPSPMSSGSESDSHSSRSRSRSRGPAKKRYCPRNSESSSSSSSRSSSRSSRSASRSPPRRRRYSYSSSHSGSWSRSRSRSRSPQRRAQWSRSKPWCSPSYAPSYDHSEMVNGEPVKRCKEKAIEERRVVYVGRIRGTMTQKELKERFSYFGEIEDCTLHFRDHGDNYGFVTYYDTKHAFTAIENGSKLRKPDELPFDLCFGGRRQFCKSNYADLDSSREYDPVPVKGKFHALDFDTLLKQAKQNQKRLYTDIQFGLV